MRDTSRLGFRQPRARRPARRRPVPEQGPLRRSQTGEVVIPTAGSGSTRKPVVPPASVAAIEVGLGAPEEVARHWLREAFLLKVAKDGEHKNDDAGSSKKLTCDPFCLGSAAAIRVGKCGRFLRFRCVRLVARGSFIWDRCKIERRLGHSVRCVRDGCGGPGPVFKCLHPQPRVDVSPFVPAHWASTSAPSSWHVPPRRDRSPASAGGRRRDRGRHEHDGCASQPQERDAEEARTDGGLKKCSLGEVSAGIDRLVECGGAGVRTPGRTTPASWVPPCGAESRKRPVLPASVATCWNQARLHVVCRAAAQSAERISERVEKPARSALRAKTSHEVVLGGAADEAAFVMASTSRPSSCSSGSRSRCWPSSTSSASCRHPAPFFVSDRARARCARGCRCPSRRSSAAFTRASASLLSASPRSGAGRPGGFASCAAEARGLGGLVGQRALLRQRLRRVLDE